MSASATNSSYVTGDTLRFYPQGHNDHYTARVLKDGRVMSVPDRRIYNNPDVWGATLPEWNINQIFVNCYGENPAAAPIKNRSLSIRCVYPYKTLLRYYPDDSENHFTAIVLSDRHVMQIKPEKETFNSVTEWLEFLAEDAREEDLTVQYPGHAECPFTKCEITQRVTLNYDDQITDDVKTLTATFDEMRIKITGPAKKAKRSLDAIFQAMQI